MNGDVDVEYLQETGFFLPFCYGGSCWEIDAKNGNPQHTERRQGENMQISKKSKEKIVVLRLLESFLVLSSSFTLIFIPSHSPHSVKKGKKGENGSR